MSVGTHSAWHGNREPNPEPPSSRVVPGMAAIISKMKIAVNNNPPTLENNPILEYFEVGQESSCAGHALVWRVFDAYRKSDGKVSCHHSPYDAIRR
ncbi:unnamed protein product, partial [Brenthis ino]